MSRALPMTDELVLLLDQAGIGVCRVGADPSEVWWSAGAAELLTGDPEAAMPDQAGLLAAVHVDDRERVHEVVTTALRTGGSYQVDHRLARDPERWISARGWVSRPEDGGWAGLTAIKVDITERKLAERELVESLGRYRQLVDAAPVGIALHQNGKMVFANPAAAEMIGWAHHELIGRPALDFVAPESRPVAQGRIEEVLGALEVDAQVPLVEQRFLRADGTPLPVLVSGSATSWKGQPAVQVVFVDLTERKRLEAQLQHSQRLESLGRLAGGVAHDFNNLLTVVLGAAEQIGQFSNDPRVENALLSIGKAARRGVGITRQLLSFARQHAVKPRPVEVGETLRSSRSLLRPLLGEDVSLELQLPTDEDLWTRIDPVQLDQVLVNLAVNARDAMPDGGTLVLAARSLPEGSDGAWIELVVQDSGEGMTAEVADHVFEPFFTTKPVGRGTGLGLSTSSGIVQQVGGTIEVHSEVGVGTRFRILLPVSEPPVAVEPEVDAISLDSSGPRPLLVVEDDPLVRRVVAEALRSRGYEVSVAADGEEAVALLRGLHRIDAMICDVVLPGMNGGEVVQRVRESFPELPALLVSGYAPDRLDPQVLGEGTDFLQKPYTVSQLVGALEELFTR